MLHIECLVNEKFLPIRFTKKAIDIRVIGQSINGREFVYKTRYLKERGINLKEILIYPSLMRERKIAEGLTILY
ncbi:19960_t:CDS:2 [Cetraspora pellucida]|uniref:19960_t:CDS:1 n=1 Tax=Cetraspora pellucida TaxID=1433469 RepID=A0A9N9N8F0_9GLOM|nr:19960_t:CDS:2 [Cetraspora pellucida]